MNKIDFMQEIYGYLVSDTLGCKLFNPMVIGPRTMYLSLVVIYE